MDVLDLPRDIRLRLAELLPVSYHNLLKTCRTLHSCQDIVKYRSPKRGVLNLPAILEYLRVLTIRNRWYPFLPYNLVQLQADFKKCYHDDPIELFKLIPKTLRYLRLTHCHLHPLAVDHLPPRLEVLDLPHDRLYIDQPLPKTLQVLKLDSNLLTTPNHSQLIHLQIPRAGRLLPVFTTLQYLDISFITLTDWYQNLNTLKILKVRDITCDHPSTIKLYIRKPLTRLNIYKNTVKCQFSACILFNSELLKQLPPSLTHVKLHFDRFYSRYLALLPESLKTVKIHSYTMGISDYKQILKESRDLKVVLVTHIC